LSLFKLYVVYLEDSTLGRIEPIKIIVKKYSLFFLKCFSLTEPEWRINNSPAPKKYSLNPYVLTVQKFTTELAGFYTCKGTREDEILFTDKAEVIAQGIF